MEYYPCLIIQDFTPEIDKMRIYGKDFVEGFIDAVSGKREYITLPVPMIARFQVSAVSRRQREKTAAMDWFLQNFEFQRPDFLLLNKIETEEGPVGDVVGYTSMFSDVPREDGRYETAYDFTLRTVIHAKSKTYSVNPENGAVTGGNFRDMTEKIKISLELKDFTTFEKILLKEFELTI